MSTTDRSKSGIGRDGHRSGRNLHALVWGQTVSMFGDFVAIFTLPYFMLSLTGNAFDLGLTSAFETAPMLIFGLAAGVIIDRRRRLRNALVGLDVLRALTFVLLATATLTDAATSWMVLAVAFLVATLTIFFDSGLQALMPEVLDESLLITANSRLAVARTIMASFGPIIAGLAVAFSAGFAIAFGLNSITFLVSAAFLTFLPGGTKERPARDERFGEALREGLRYLFGDGRLKWGTLGGTFTNFVFAPLEALLVYYVAVRILDIDVATDGFDLTEYGVEIGVFFGLLAFIGASGVALAPRGSTRLPLGTMYVIGLFMFGGSFLVVVLLDNLLAVIPAGIALIGITWVNIALATMRQRLTPRPLLGRVISASRTVSWVGLPLGAAIGGAVAAAFGVVPVYLVGASSILLVAAFLMRTPLYRDPVMADPAQGAETA